MGWTYTTKEHGSVLDFFKKEFNHDGEKTSFRLLDGAVKNIREFYGVVERVNKLTGAIARYGIVCLLDWRKEDLYNFGYKDMDETCGPYYYGCPAKILALLEDYPPENEESAKWREKCREVAAKQAKVKSLKDGFKIKLETPLRFRDGLNRQKFTVNKKGRKVLFVGEDGVACRIPDIKKREFEIMS